MNARWPSGWPVVVAALMALSAGAADPDPLHIKDPEQRLQSLLPAFAPERRATLSEYQRAAWGESVITTLRFLKRTNDLRRFLVDLEAWEPVRARRQAWCFELGETCREGDQPAALVAYERVFTDYPECPARWASAQERIVEVLAAAGRLEDALRAAHVWWDTAGDGHTLNRASARIADLLKRIDGNSGRAEAWATVQRYGPAGQDGRPGTADDPGPVLPLAYPDGAARRQAFASAAALMGDGAEGARLRGVACLYAGDPQAARAQFADALRRCPAGDVVRMTQAVSQGFRAVQGHGAGPDPVGPFVAYGAVGRDGRPGTEDDLPDPFAAAGLALAPASATGEAADMGELVGSLRRFAARGDQAERRALVLAAYQRACESMADMDRDEALAWVRARLADEKDERVLAALVRLGQTVAKIGRFDLSGVRAFDRSVKQGFEAAQRALPADVVTVLGRTESTAHVLDPSAPR